jgi:hypothetical protein
MSDVLCNYWIRDRIDSDLVDIDWTSAGRSKSSDQSQIQSAKIHYWDQNSNCACSLSYCSYLKDARNHNCYTGYRHKKSGVHLGSIVLLGYRVACDRYDTRATPWFPSSGCTMSSWPFLHSEVWPPDLNTMVIYAHS